MAGTVIAAGAKILSTVGSFMANPVTQATMATAKTASEIKAKDKATEMAHEQKMLLESQQKKQRKQLRGQQQRAFSDRKAGIDKQRRVLMGAGDKSTQYSISQAGTDGGSLTGVSLG